MTARLLGLRVRILPWASMSVSFESCVLSGRFLCVRLITRPEDPADCGVSACDPADCGVSACNREASIMGRPSPTRGCFVMGGNMSLFTERVAN